MLYHEARTLKSVDGKWFFASLIAAIAVISVHGDVLEFRFVNWDDNLHVLKNPSVITPTEVPIIRHLFTPYLGYPIPLTVATYIIEYAIFGPDPAYFHFTSLVIHLISTILLLLAMKRVGCGPALSLLGALVFALHPATAEPVSWISGRKDVLSGMFAIAALAAFIKARDKERLTSHIPALVLLVLASLSKPSVSLLPLLFIALETNRKKTLRLWGAVMAFDLAIIGATFFMESQVGALGEAKGVFTRLLSGAYWHSRIIFWPFDLMPKYLDEPTGIESYKLVLGLFVITLTLIALVFAWIRKHPAHIGLTFALLTYLPQSGVVPLVRQYADCYTYLPLAGLCLAGVCLARDIAPAIGIKTKAFVTVCTVVLLISLGFNTHQHAQIYKDGVTLWSVVYRAYPDSPQVCRNLGNAYMFDNRDEPESAIRVYKHCIRTLGNRRFFLKNLAIATARAGRIEEAAALFKELASDRVNLDDER